jgi:uncharacterized repeat protein (TIGR03803 family)
MHCSQQAVAAHSATISRKEVIMKAQPNLKSLSALKRHCLPSSAGALVVTIALLLTLLLAPVAQAQFSVIHNFTNGGDGATPYGGLTMDPAGNLYGTASAGGANGDGTVYKMSFRGSNWILTPLYAFQNGADGNTPTSGVARASNGVLYGSAFSGGAYGVGTVFKLTPPPTVGSSALAPWKETTLYSFTGSSDGANPDMIGGRLALDHAGNLYGTALNGGDLSCPSGISGCGTVFQLSPSNGGWTESTLHTFLGSPNDGATPYGDVILDTAGNVYGMTISGGSNNPPTGFGTLFQLTPSGSGWSGTILWNFCGPSSCLDGANPSGGLVLDASGNLYGASYNAVLELVKSGGGFSGNLLYTSLCCYPNGNLIWDGAGNLYGTNAIGGAFGYGNVFELSPSGGQYWTYTSLYDFTGGSDGGEPFGTLVFDAAGDLYGTASMGGSGGSCSGGCGVVFKIAL